MKILMIAPQPFFQPRGTPFSVLGRLHTLSKLGHNVDLVTYHIGQDVQIPNVTIHRIKKVPFIKNIKIGPSITKIPVDILLFFKSIFMLRKYDYDVLHTHEEAGFMGILFQKWFDVPHLYDMHSSLPQQLHNFQFSKSKILHYIFRSLEDSTLKSAKGVITICPELYYYVEDLGIAQNHELIENVVDFASLFSDKNGENDHEIFHDEKIKQKTKVLYVGTLEPYQGIDLLIKGARSVVDAFPNVLYLIVGGKPEQVEHYKNLTQKEGISDFFIFTGSVPPRAAEKFVDFSDILLTPRTTGNNTPLKIYSYLRSGKPIIATRLITHTQVLDDSVSILTEPDPQNFSDGILKVLKDENLKNSITKNAKQLAEDKYSYSVYVKKIQKILDNLNTN